MRKRKGGQAPSVSVDVEERIPSSVQVSAVVEEEERTPLHKGGEKKQQVCESLLRWSPSPTGTICTACD